MQIFHNIADTFRQEEKFPNGIVTLKRIKNGFKKSLGPHKYYCNFRQKQFSWQGLAAGCAPDRTSWQPLRVAFSPRADEYLPSLGTLTADTPPFQAPNSCSWSHPGQALQEEYQGRGPKRQEFPGSASL